MGPKRVLKSAPPTATAAYAANRKPRIVYPNPPLRTGPKPLKFAQTLIRQGFKHVLH
jgi:hypothetical protein